MEPIYEGKAKRLFTTDDPNVLRMEYKDSATAFNGVKKEDFENKGRFNKAITLIIYRMLEAKGVATHLVDDVDDINLLVKKVSIIPLEVIVRNVAAGSFSKRMGVAEGTAFKKPIVEFSYKDDSLGDPFINDDYAREMGAATEEECAAIKKMALLVNETLRLSWDVWPKTRAALCWPTRFPRTPAACGTWPPAKRWTRIASARGWVSSWNPTPRCWSA